MNRNNSTKRNSPLPVIIVTTVLAAVAVAGASVFGLSALSRSKGAGSSFSGYSDASSGQSTGVHHSGAVWDGTGSPLHIYENGKTSYGYNWTYEGGGGLIKVGCDYTFASNSYDFSIIGTAPGTSSVTLYYNTSDDQKIPVTVNFTVDDNMVVTQN